MYTSAGIADEQGGEPTAQNAWYDLIILVDQTFGLTHVEDTCMPNEDGSTHVLVLNGVRFVR
jgi:hypothetical protein